MKKFCIFFALVMFTIVLTACNTEKTRTFEKEESGMASTMIYTYSGDEVIELTAENTMNYESLGIGKMLVEEILNSEIEQLENIDGVNYNIEIGDEEALETFTIDFENLDYEKAKNIDIVPIQGSEDESVSMEESAETLEGQGYIEVEE